MITRIKYIITRINKKDKVSETREVAEAHHAYTSPWYEGLEPTEVYVTSPSANLSHALSKGGRGIPLLLPPVNGALQYSHFYLKYS